MSKAYWDFATELEAEARRTLEISQSSFLVFPTIIFFCASFEALINEGLTGKLIDDKTNIKDIINLKNSSEDYHPVFDKINQSAIYLDKKGEGNISENILHEYKVLNELRNAIIHYNPEFGSIYNYPPRLEETLKRSKVKIKLTSNWVETFKTVETLN